MLDLMLNCMELRQKPTEKTTVTDLALALLLVWLDGRRQLSLWPLLRLLSWGGIS